MASGAETGYKRNMRNKQDKSQGSMEPNASPRAGRGPDPSSVFQIPDEVHHLDTLALAKLTEVSREWLAAARSQGTRVSRLRFLLVYLMLRWSGARLGEVLALDDRADLDLKRGVARFGEGEERREVALPEEVAREIAEALELPEFARMRGEVFHLDPAHVRRKLYERADACNLPRECANPSALRRSRAIELMRGGVPLTIVQKLLGHSTASLTASYLDFGEDDRRRITEQALAREAKRLSSARNAFYGKVSRVTRGDIQALVELATPGGHKIAALVTLQSLEALGLRPGVLARAEVKAPWVGLVAGEDRPRVSAANILAGVVESVRQGALTSEISLRLADGTQLCSVVTSEGLARLGLEPGMPAWATFGASAVILGVD